jgi:hypothetical protein
MDELDIFLNFVYKHIKDDRISVYKKMKYGYRHYHISVNMELSEDDNTVNALPNLFARYSSGWNQIVIVLDNRNKCIEINSSVGNEVITVENDILLNKWSEIFEEYTSSKIDESVKKLITTLFSNSKDKDLHREYIMKDIIKDDEDESI